MKLGMISGYSDESFDFAKSIGMEFIEICCNYDDDCENVIAAESGIAENIKRASLPVLSLGRWNHDINVGGRLDEKKFGLYCRTLECAVNLGCEIFVCGCNEDKSVGKYKNYTAAIELFGRLIDKAGNSGIKIAVQNCDWNNFIVSPADWDIVFGELPSLTLKYDCSHSYNRGDSYIRELSDYGHLVSHFHLKGTTHAQGGHRIDDPPAGMDDIQWSSVFSALYARDYNGGLSIEPHSGTWKNELGKKGILFTYNYIKQYILR